MHEHALRAGADLAAVGMAGGHDRRDRQVEVRVAPDDRRSLAPSSSATRVRFAAAAAMIALPVSRWPVNETIEVSSSLTSAAPVDGPPVTRLITPSGRSRCSSISLNSSIVDSGVTSLGLTTSVLPVSSAGASLRASTASGKFHGQIAATTPTGARSRWMTSPATSPGRMSPSSRRSHSAL